MGLVAIRVDDILVSGGDMFIEYITQRMEEKSEVGRYGENEATYLGMDISEVNNDDFDGIVAGSNKYEAEIYPIGIPNARTRNPKEPLGESDQSNLRSGLGKLMRLARITRPDAMYDASAAAQTFPDGGIIDFLEWRGNFGKRGKLVEEKEQEGRFWTQAWFY